MAKDISNHRHGGHWRTLICEKDVAIHCLFLQVKGGYVATSGLASGGAGGRRAVIGWRVTERRTTNSAGRANG